MPSKKASHALRIAGAVSIAAAALSAVAAWLHMRALAEAYGVICGSGAGQLAHCPACYASVAELALAVACFALARAASPAPLRVRAR